MNFDDIKSAWSKTPESNITVPNRIADLKRAELPLDKIKRNMRYEFVVQIIAVILLGFAPMVLNLKPTLLLPFNAVYILLVITCIYFFARFYAFYKRISSISLNTKDTLYEVNYDIRLNMELYKMFTYMLFPFVFIQIGIFAINKKYDYFIALLQSEVSSTSTFYLTFIVSTVIIYAFLHFSATYWLKAYYSKYAKEIERILKELKEE